MRDSYIRDSDVRLPKENPANPYASGKEIKPINESSSNVAFAVFGGKANPKVVFVEGSYMECP